MFPERRVCGVVDNRSARELPCGYVVPPRTVGARERHDVANGLVHEHHPESKDSRRPHTQLALSKARLEVKHQILPRLLGDVRV